MHQASGPPALEALLHKPDASPLPQKEPNGQLHGEPQEHLRGSACDGPKPTVIVGRSVLLRPVWSLGRLAALPLMGGGGVTTD
jgi:hypothetical protein